MESRGASEPTHQQILAEIRTSRDEQRRAHDKLSGRMEGRFDGVDKEIRGIRAALSSAEGRVAVLEAGDHAEAAPTPRGQAEDGMPFRAGWPRRLAIAGFAVAALGGLKAAASGLVDVGQAVIVAVGQYIHTPPH